MHPSKNFAKRFEINSTLKSSKIHALGFALLSLVLLLAVFNSELSRFAWVLVPAVLYYLYGYYQQHFGPGRMRQLVLPDADLLASYVRLFYVVLIFKKGRVVVLPDSLDSDTFRRLRVLAQHPHPLPPLPPNPY